MKKTLKDESGFGVVEVILILIIIVLLGVVGWIVYRNQNKKTDGRNNTNTSEVSNKTDDQNNTNASTQISDTKTPEVSNITETVDNTDYVTSVTKGVVKIEISPKSGPADTTVKYRLTGLTYKLDDNLQIIFVDYSGHHRSLAAFAMTDSRVDSVKIPEKVFGCNIGQDCTTEVATANGMGKILVTHSNDFIEDISIDFEVK